MDEGWELAPTLPAPIRGGELPVYSKQSANKKAPDWVQDYREEALPFLQTVAETNCMRDGSKKHPTVSRSHPGGTSKIARLDAISKMSSPTCVKSQQPKGRGSFWRSDIHPSWEQEIFPPWRVPTTQVLGELPKWRD